MEVETSVCCALLAPLAALQLASWGFVCSTRHAHLVLPRET